MMRCACIFGGSWLNDENAGSRQANLDYWAENSNDNIGARGRSDDRFPALRRLRPRRPSTYGRARCGAPVGGQPDRPASANTQPGPVQRGVGRLLAVRYPRPAFRTSHGRQMAKRYRNLMGRITADDNMLRAYRLTAAGKRLTPGYLEFKEFSVLNLDRLAGEMRRGEYRPDPAHQFIIYDPKYRVISAQSFRDRVAQHALCDIIGPLFDRALLPRTFASRPGKGTHAGVVALQSDLRRLGGPLYFLKTDFSRYFASVDLVRLHRLVRAKISDAATLRLIEAMVPASGIGLPIGSLTSQIFANLYTGATLDRHLQQDLGERYWYRYMDDLVVLGRSSEHLRAVRDDIEAFSRDQLSLRFSKWQIAPVSRGINFLGYRIWPSHKLLRRDSVTRARRKLKAYRAAGDRERERKFLAAWLGHASWADSRNLLRSLSIDGEGQ